MGKYNFDDPIQRRGSGCLKWDRCDEDTLPFWIADMDFEVAPEIKERMQPVSYTHLVDWFAYRLRSNREFQCTCQA